MPKPAKFLIALVSAATLGAAALTGCGGDAEPTSPDSAAPTVTASDAATQDAPGNRAPSDLQTGETVDKEQFSDALNEAMADIKSYEAVTKMTVDMGGGTVMDVEGLMQVDATDEANPKIYSKSTNSVSGTSESISIRDTVYMRADGETMWTKQVIEDYEEQVKNESGLETTDSMANDAETISYVGESTVNGAPAYKYELTDSAGELMYIHIDADHRMVMFEFGGETTMTATYSKFNEKFDITEPPADQVAG